MENSHQALWDKCLHLIEANVTEQQFKTWFAPIVFESYSEAEGRAYASGAGSKYVRVRVLGAVLRGTIK